MPEICELQKEVEKGKDSGAFLREVAGVTPDERRACASQVCSLMKTTIKTTQYGALRRDFLNVFGG